jgi:putative nucleotidyltransferase with HDIG domain
VNEQLFLDLQDYFDHYVSSYSFTDPQDQQNIDLKYEHSYQVKNNMTHLTAKMLNQKQSYIAQTIALFHDFGRFKQYQKYKTFADAKSEDHAQLGVNILQEKQILSALEPRISELILKAISYHNKPYLPSNEKEEVLLYTKLIRDADKLDIWRVVLTNFS